MNDLTILIGAFLFVLLFISLASAALIWSLMRANRDLHNRLMFLSEVNAGEYERLQIAKKRAEERVELEQLKKDHKAANNTKKDPRVSGFDVMKNPGLMQKVMQTIKGQTT